MTRIVHTFRYGGDRAFLAGDLTVGTYAVLLRDPDEAVRMALAEFNDIPPVLSAREMTKFLRILLSTEDTLFGKKAPSSDAAKDFHLQIAFFMKHLHQPLSDILAMPLALFSDILRDAEIVLGLAPYDPNRHSKRLDSARLREVFGGKDTVRS